jgi:predicted DNA-binding transcriptional regulator AlpA
MSRPKVPSPSPPVAPLLTVDEIAALLQIHPAQVDRLVSAGLPCLDVSGPPLTPGRRVKRALRFDQAAVTRWLEERAQRRVS